MKQVWSILLLVLSLSSLSEPATLEVGPGQTYTTIGAAITAATAGDTLNIHAATYDERPDVSKSVTLQRNGSDVVTIAPTAAGTGITVSANAVTLDGLTLTGWNGAGNWGIALVNRDQVTVKNCTIHTPVGVVGSSIYTRNSTRITLQNNTIYGSPGGPGVGIVSGHSTDATYANGIIVTGNTIRDNAVDGVQTHGEYITISNNLIYRNITTAWETTHPDGIQLIPGVVDTFDGNRFIKIYNNTIYSHTQNIFAEGGTGNKVGDVYIYNNIVYSEAGIVNGVDLDAIALQGISLKEIGGTGNVYVYNNTIGRHSNIPLRVSTASTASTVFMRNNIISNNFGGGTAGLSVDACCTTGINALNHNLYFVAGGTEINWGGTDYTTLASFNSATGFEANGVTGDPLLDASYNLLVNSPAINAGMSLASFFTTDKDGLARPQGVAWDIGADEFAGAGTPTVETFTTAGTFTNGWTAPANVTSVTAEAWGGGGAGGSDSSSAPQGGGGGAGGDYAKKVITVTPASAYTYIVGAAGTAGAPGVDGGFSRFTGDSSVKVEARGGNTVAQDVQTGGAPGGTGTNDGTTIFLGGSGATSTGNGMGGGGSGGSASTGTTATGTSGASAVTDGGPGGNGAGSSNVAGSTPASGPGGVGGGARRTSGATKTGGAGRAGQVKLAYLTVLTAPANPSAVAGNTTVALNWDDVSGATTYKVYRGTSAGTEVLLTSGLGTSAYTDNAVVNFTTYYYKFTAVNASGESAGSNEVSATPTAPVVSLSTSSLTFQQQVVDTTSAAQTVTLTNTGGLVLNITSITKTGTHPTNYAFTGCGNGGATTVAASANCVMSVTFTPSATGTRTANLSIANDAAGTPHVITLTGTGGAPPQVTASLTASYRSILPGQTSVLTHITQDANVSCTINQGIGAVTPCPGTGTVNVSPTVTTTYTLTAVGATGTAESSVTIYPTRNAFGNTGGQATARP